MQLELLLTNERRILPSVQAFTDQTLKLLPLNSSSAKKLSDVVLAAVTDAIDHAYPEGEEGEIRLTITESRGKLEISIRDYGLPVDTKLLEQETHDRLTSGLSLFGCPASEVVDQVHWLAFGPDGKALQLVKWLNVTHVAESSPSGALEAMSHDVPVATDQQYTIRRMEPHEAIEVCRLMYRAYGGTYFNQDVYFPERVAALNAHDAVISFVAQAEDGTIAGHYALELNQEGPVAECGQAVVDPSHRGRGLLDRMRAAAEQEAASRNLVGLYSDAVAVHTLTQRSNVTHGHHLVGVDLAMSPRTEQFRKIAEEQPQRVSCMMYFQWLHPPTQRTLYVPHQHRAVISEVYENLDCGFCFGDGTPPAGHGVLKLKLVAAAAIAFVRVEQPGADSVSAIRHARRELVEQSHAEAVYAELPLAHPSTPHLVEALEAEGFGFTGVAPNFSTSGDILRLAYLVEPLERNPIKTYDAFGDRLVNYTLSEQARVRKIL